MTGKSKTKDGKWRRLKNKIFQSRDLCLRALDTNSLCAKNVRRNEEKMELKIENLTKQYAGKTAVDHLSCTFTPGIVGLLGANGAGKSTLMRMVCGVMKPTSGTIALDEYPVTDKEYRNFIGYLPQDFGYYPEFTGMEFMLYVAALKGLDKNTARTRSLQLLEQVNLEKDAQKKIKAYSGGMKRRLGIAQTLLNRPKLIVLDEPTAGLDPKERVRFRHIFEQLGKDSIVLLSTHIVSDLEKCADRIMVMKDGQKVFDGTEEETGKDLETFYLDIFGGEE